jgi:hypothetical protein
MKEAVGTSLVIIAAKSLIGFFGEGEKLVEWQFLFYHFSIYNRWNIHWKTALLKK